MTEERQLLRPADVAACWSHGEQVYSSCDCGTAAVRFGAASASRAAWMRAPGQRDGRCSHSGRRR